jgi:hypothetical protein
VSSIEWAYFFIYENKPKSTVRLENKMGGIECQHVLARQ